MYEDEATRETDRRLALIKRRLRKLYAQAEEELTKKLSDWLTAHRARDAKYRKMVAEGKMSEEDYKAWLQGQVFQRTQWQDARSQVIREMVRVDQSARKIVDGEKRDIFLENANFVGYQLEKNMRIDVGFNLFDNATVAQLVEKEPDLLRPLSPKKVLQGKEIPYYQKIVTNAITQGIVQGEGIPEITKRITDTCVTRAADAAVRDARTAYTSAQNAGRVAAMKEVEADLGIKIQKMWMATLDDKTRHTHQELDGQVVDADKHFVTDDGDELMYPGDPSGKPQNVYNCRCRMRNVYPDVKAVRIRRDNMTVERVVGMTYKEWKKMKQDKGEWRGKK